MANANFVIRNKEGFKITSCAKALYFLNEMVVSCSGATFNIDGTVWDLWKDNSGWHLAKQECYVGLIGISVEYSNREGVIANWLYHKRKYVNKYFFS